jgi:WD40 repeat protein
MRQVASIDDHNDVVQSLDFSPILGEMILASVSIDNIVGLHNIITQQPLSQPVMSGDEPVIALGAGEDGAIYTIRQSSSGVNLTQIKDGSESIRYPLSGNVSTAGFTNDSDRLALGFRDGTVQLIDVDTGTQITSFLASQNVSPVFSLAIHPDGQLLATSHCTSQIFIGDENKEFCSDNEIYLWNLDSGERLATIPTTHTGLIRSLAFDPSGKYLASGSDDQTILLWDWESGEQVSLPLAKHRAGVTSLSFSSDGSMLASGSDDRDLILWDIPNNRQQIGDALVGSTGSVLSLVFNQDNASLFSGTSTGSILSWDVNPESWVGRVCELAGRNLTEAEWQLFLPQTDYSKTCPQLP